MQAKIKIKQKIKMTKKRTVKLYSFNFALLEGIIKKRRNPSRIEKKTQTPEQ